MGINCNLPKKKKKKKTKQTQLQAWNDARKAQHSPQSVFLDKVLKWKYYVADINDLRWNFLVTQASYQLHEVLLKTRHTRFGMTIDFNFDFQWSCSFLPSLNSNWQQMNWSDVPGNVRHNIPLRASFGIRFSMKILRG